MTNQNSKMSERETKTQGQKLKKTSRLTIVTMLIAAVILGYIFFVTMFRVTVHPPGMDCRVNIITLGKAMQIYAIDYDDQYPTAEKWSDLLVMYCDLWPRAFVCKSSDAIKGESSYAFNKNLIGKRPTDVPPDVVVLFETNLGKNPLGRQALFAERDWHKFLDYPDSEEKVFKLRWNQFGGPEILTFENHEGKGCNVLFNDGRVEFIEPEEVGKLRWEVEQKQ